MWLCHSVKKRQKKKYGEDQTRQEKKNNNEKIEEKKKWIVTLVTITINRQLNLAIIDWICMHIV